MAKKRIAYALSAAALMAGSGLFAPTTWAEGDCVASDLASFEACLAGDSETISATGTIVVSGEGVEKIFVVNKDINGAADYDLFHIEDGAKVVVRGTGTINAGRYFAIADGAELVIDGPTINAISPSSYGVYAKDNGRVTMESGQVVADYAAFAGNNTTGDMNFYINGGLLKSNRYPAIYMPGQVDLVMRGGTLDGGIVARMGQIVIEDGTINKQSSPVAGDGLDVNYSSMPSMADEAITLVAGSYKSSNASYGNDMNVTIAGGNVQINGDIVLYDLGNTATGYEQDVNVRIEEGRLTGFKTKYTEEEIGFALKSGYTAGLNYAADRINVEIIGGEFTTEPAEENIVPGYEAELNEDTNVYEIYPKLVDYSDWGIESDFDDEDQLPVYVEFDDEFIADRKATLSALVVENIDELTLTGEGELLGAVDITMYDRDAHVIEVSDNHLVVYIDLDEETYNELSQYDELYAVYFNEDGEEEERFEVSLEAYTEEDYAWYWLSFETTHLSTYGIVGVNGEDEEESTAAPDTGTVTAAGASAVSAALVTAIAVGLLTSIISFAYLIRRR